MRQVKRTRETSKKKRMRTDQRKWETGEAVEGLNLEIISFQAKPEQRKGASRKKPKDKHGGGFTRPKGQRSIWKKG